MAHSRNYWLIKTEPDTFSIENLAHSPNQIAPWEGVRNYQARNMLKNQMKVGDLAFFYHSSCKIPGIVGIVEIVKAGYPDNTAWDSKSHYYDPKSSPENPRWYRVDVHLVQKFSQIISLQELKKISSLQHMLLLRKGNRLSVMPVKTSEWKTILSLIKKQK